MPSKDHTYSEREVEEILRRATEDDDVKALAQPDGMSLAELKTIGAEVGIDPERIEHAAHSLVRSPEARGNPLVGGPTAFDYEARVPGEIATGRTPDVIALIRRITGKTGKLSEVQGTLEWRADGEMGSRWVTVSSHDGHTTIRASSRLGQGAALSFMPLAAATIAAAIPVLNAPSADGNMMALLLIPLILGLYLTIRGLWSRHTRKEDESLGRLVEELGALAEPRGDDDV